VCVVISKAIFKNLENYASSLYSVVRGQVNSLGFFLLCVSPYTMCYLIEGGDSGFSLLINTKWNLAVIRSLALRAPVFFKQNGALPPTPPSPVPRPSVFNCLPAKLMMYKKSQFGINPGTNKAALDRDRVLF
jgi:hypothetical protein